jgi:hypothetical protein
VAGNVTVVPDANGVGEVVIEIMRKHNVPDIHPVTTFGRGEQTTMMRNGWYSVPKRDVAMNLVSLHEQDRMRVSRSIPHYDLWKKELAAFRRTVSEKTGHDSYEAMREGDHDDLVMASALALWYAVKFTQNTFRIREGPQKADQRGPKGLVDYDPFSEEDALTASERRKYRG